MASYLAGFKFADGTFFNAALFKDEYDRLRGPLRMTMCLTIAHEKAQELNLNLTDTTLTQYKLGGYPEAVDLAQLYRIHEESCGASNSVVEPAASSVEDVSKDACNWSHSSVMLLIETVRDFIAKGHFSNSAFKRIKMWASISDIMVKNGYQYSAGKCTDKWRALKHRYKQICDRNKQTGRGAMSWEYFELMKDVLEGDPSVIPNITISTIEDNQDSEKSCKVDCGPTQKQITSTSPQAEKQRTPRLKRKREEPPVWFKEFSEKQDRLLERVMEQHEKSMEIQEKTMEIQEKSMEILKERNEILKQLMAKK